MVASLQIVASLFGALSVAMMLPQSVLADALAFLSQLTTLDLQFINAFISVHRLQLFYSLAAASLLTFVWEYVNRPMHYVRRLEETGYIADGVHSMEVIANNTRKRRQGGDLPPPFPNGWYFVIWSDELKVGEVKQVSLLGQLLAVFRGENGQSAVLDAYCPHLGANLAVGGSVVGCELQCPFHGWKFDAEGKCVHIPYAEEVPKFAKTKAWTSREVNGQILVWFDAEEREPLWEIMGVENVNNGKWKCRGRTEGYLNAHIQEVPENGADIHHLNFLHSPFVLNGVDLRKTRKLIGILDHTWVASWTPMEPPNQHVANLKLTHRLSVMGVLVPLFDFSVDAFQVGPGLVYLTWSFLLGRGAFFQTMSPVEPMLQKISHTVWTDWWIPPFIASILMMAEIRQVERDMMVWNNKRFISKPLLVKEDKLIGQFRRWFSQFYSDNSREYGKKNNLDW